MSLSSPQTPSSRRSRSSDVAVESSAVIPFISVSSDSDTDSEVEDHDDGLSMFHELPIIRGSSVREGSRLSQSVQVVLDGRIDQLQDDRLSLTSPRDRRSLQTKQSVLSREEGTSSSLGLEASSTISQAQVSTLQPESKSFTTPSIEEATTDQFRKMLMRAKCLPLEQQPEDLEKCVLQVIQYSDTLILAKERLDRAFKVKDEESEKLLKLRYRNQREIDQLKNDQVYCQKHVTHLENQLDEQLERARRQSLIAQRPTRTSGSKSRQDELRCLRTKNKDLAKELERNRARMSSLEFELEEAVGFLKSAVENEHKLRSELYERPFEPSQKNESECSYSDDQLERTSSSVIAPSVGDLSESLADELSYCVESDRSAESSASFKSSRPFAPAPSSPLSTHSSFNSKASQEVESELRELARSRDSPISNLVDVRSKDEIPLSSPVRGRYRNEKLWFSSARTRAQPDPVDTLLPTETEVVGTPTRGDHMNQFSPVSPSSSIYDSPVTPPNAGDFIASTINALGTSQSFTESFKEQQKQDILQMLDSDEMKLSSIQVEKPVGTGWNFVFDRDTVTEDETKRILGSPAEIPGLFAPGVTHADAGVNQNLIRVLTSLSKVLLYDQSITGLPEPSLLQNPVLSTESPYLASPRSTVDVRHDGTDTNTDNDVKHLSDSSNSYDSHSSPQSNEAPESTASSATTLWLSNIHQPTSDTSIPKDLVGTPSKGDMIGLDELEGLPARSPNHPRPQSSSFHNTSSTLGSLVLADFFTYSPESISDGSSIESSLIPRHPYIVTQPIVSKIEDDDAKLQIEALVSIESRPTTPEAVSSHSIQQSTEAAILPDGGPRRSQSLSNPSSSPNLLSSSSGQQMSLVMIPEHAQLQFSTIKALLEVNDGDVDDTTTRTKTSNSTDESTASESANTPRESQLIRDIEKLIAYPPEKENEIGKHEIERARLETLKFLEGTVSSGHHGEKLRPVRDSPAKGKTQQMLLSSPPESYAVMPSDTEYGSASYGSEPNLDDINLRDHDTGGSDTNSRDMDEGDEPAVSGPHDDDDATVCDLDCSNYSDAQKLSTHDFHAADANHADVDIEDFDSSYIDATQTVDIDAEHLRSSFESEVESHYTEDNDPKRFHPPDIDVKNVYPNGLEIDDTPDLRTRRCNSDDIYPAGPETEDVDNPEVNNTVSLKDGVTYDLETRNTANVSTGKTAGSGSGILETDKGKDSDSGDINMSNMNGLESDGTGDLRMGSMDDVYVHDPEIEDRAVSSTSYFSTDDFGKEGAVMQNLRMNDGDRLDPHSIESVGVDDASDESITVSSNASSSTDPTPNVDPAVHSNTTGDADHTAESTHTPTTDITIESKRIELSPGSQSILSAMFPYPNRAEVVIRCRGQTAVQTISQYLPSAILLWLCITVWHLKQEWLEANMSIVRDEISAHRDSGWMWDGAPTLHHGVVKILDQWFKPDLIV